MSKKAAKLGVPELSGEDAPASDWPSTVGTRKELDDALEAGRRSGVSGKTVSSVWAAV